jgi:hypothetical protein
MSKPMALLKGKGAMVDGDRRRQSRYNVRIPGRLTVSANERPVVIVDISEDGIGLEASLSLAPETAVAVEVGETCQSRFTFRGKVMWCLQGQGNGLPAYRMGLSVDTIGSVETTAVSTDEKWEMLGRITNFYARPDQGLIPG